MGCWADIAWWTTFVGQWNGVALFPNLLHGHTLISDASGIWGCGAYIPESGQWFQIRWPNPWASVNITVKELLPIVTGAAIWGSSWKGTVVLIQSDNQAVVSCLSSRSRATLTSHTYYGACFFPKLTMSLSTRPGTSQVAVILWQMHSPMTK